MIKYMAIALTMFAILPFRALARDVIGINKYMTYDQVKEAFDYRFNGGEYSYQENRKMLFYSDVTFAGVPHGVLYAGFTNNHIENALFTWYFKTVEYAKKKREMINMIFKNEYGDCKSRILRNGFKEYLYFTYDGKPIDYCVAITVMKTKLGKEEFYACKLRYDFSDYDTDTDGI